MSRGQQGQVFDQSQSENTSYNTNAQDAFKTAEGDVGSYGDAVGKFAAANPYTAGGTVATADNQATADAAAGAAQSYGSALQGQAVRTGQNAGGAIAATEKMAEQNERNLVGQEAEQNKERAAAGTGYGEAVLGATANKEAMQDTLAREQATAAQGALGTQEQAAQTPSFMDELGQGIISAGSNFAGAYGKALGGCWIAAELFGGWDDWRTIRVRTWLLSSFARHWYGEPILWAYARWGQRVAETLRTRRRLRTLFQRIFDAALRKAVTDGQ